MPTGRQLSINVEPLSIPRPALPVAPPVSSAPPPVRQVPSPAASEASRDDSEAATPVVGTATGGGSGTGTAVENATGGRGGAASLEGYCKSNKQGGFNHNNPNPNPNHTLKRPDAHLVIDPTVSTISDITPILSPTKRPCLRSSSGSIRLGRSISQHSASAKQHPELPPGTNLGFPATPADMLGRQNGEYGHQVVARQLMQRANAVADSATTAELAASWPVCDDDPATPRSSPLLSPLLPLRDLSIVELLDQDDRPTFIVDLTDKANFRPGPLQAVFANTALRAERSVFGPLVNTAYVSTTASQATQAEDFVRFKGWLLTLARSNGQAHERNPSVSSTTSNFSLPFSLAGLRWTCSTLRQRYRVVRGSHCSCADSGSFSADARNCISNTAAVRVPPHSTWVPEGTLASPTETAADGEDYFGTANITTEANCDNNIVLLGEDRAHLSYDWTQIELTGDTPQHIRLARSIDWAATPLGPVELWPADLRTISNMVMGSPNAAIMYWGPEYTAIYNEAYVSLAGRHHPGLMGSKTPLLWGQDWANVQATFRTVWNSGKAMIRYDDPVFMNRSGFLEETFLNWSIVPLIGSDGSVVGLLNPVFDNTKRWVNERRMQTLNELGEMTSKAQTVQRFWHSVMQGLEKNQYDIPFVLVYSVASIGDDDESEQAAMHSSGIGDSANPTTPPQLMLEGSLGVTPGHPAAVATLDLHVSSDGFAPYMRQAMGTTTTGSATEMATPTPVVLSAEKGTLPAGLLTGLQGQRGFGDDCHTVVVFPVYHPTALTAGTGCAALVAGFIVMGANPRRPYNREYQLFVHLLARQLTTSFSSAVLFEEETRRAERLARRAVRDKQELSQQLRLRTQQVVESENKFMRMAEFTPVGMFVTDARGRITYCNDMWWEISQFRRLTRGGDKTKGESESFPAFPGDDDVSVWSSWMESVEVEDRAGLEAVWERMVLEKVQVTHEFRFRQKTRQPINTRTSEKTEMTTWVLLRAYPEKDEKTGELKSIFGCIMDISQQKLAEAFESQRRQEAVEHKRQQENFIDITSHEMRNPLSAILQSVDEIMTSVAGFRAAVEAGQAGDVAALDDLLEDVLEAISTISLCANHQKRIVDDVLTLSKLDSKLLLVRPTAVQPVMVVRTTLKIFEAEFYARDIRCILRVQPSYESLVGAGGWVKLDPSRLAQVIINLITNAVRSTQASENRTIMISLGASREGELMTEPGVVDVADDVAEGKLVYIPRRLDDADVQPEGPEWGTGTKLNLHIAVADTGKDLNKGERDILFHSCAHKLPRTHVEYGGPGLGLFISWNLAELQGGQIGVASRKDQGSVFAFYVKCRMADEYPPNGQSADEIMGMPAAGEPENRFVTVYSIGLENGGLSMGMSLGMANSDDTEASLAMAGPRVLPAALRHYHSSRAAVSTAVDSTADNSPTTTPATPTTTATTAAPMPHIGLPLSDDLPCLDVLIVEDNIVNQRVLQRQLDKCGNRTHVANHGGEALEALRRSRFWRDGPAADEQHDIVMDAVVGQFAALDASKDKDKNASSLGGDGGGDNGNDSNDSRPATSINISIVLMDLEMPVMDGLTCARAIRDLERSGTLVRHVPIIAVTAYARPEQIENAKAAGIDDVIAKPFRLAQLMPKILELVRKYQTI
ncbi:ethylene receptor [Grosmannia clavigera kw1407]|uniref:Ethylene receptor n=1 Tax=Grosmannia clavigera (strain kw1407 / UAMH 11150) TaxID=655863 RepID=F0XAK3_GROCL|nr:ethylene receptor [Grosmannia clavigera kw1407]EFX05752.1 ethylene receptor [Grosmannia clavigera kw1407]